MEDNHLNIYPIVVPTASQLQSYNFYLVKTKNKLILIDAGMNTELCWQQLHFTLKQHGYTFQHIDEILMTHSHLDHTGLVPRIMHEHPNVKLFAHESSLPRLRRELNFFEKRLQFFDRLYEDMGCGTSGKKQVELLQAKMQDHGTQAITGTVYPLQDNDTINGLKVYFAPGHWPDQIVFLHEPTATLFAGDLLIEHISTNALVEPDFNGERLRSLMQHEASLHKMLQVPLQTVYAGHGNIIHNPIELITKRLQGIERKSKRLINVLKSLKKASASTIAIEMYPHKYDSEFSLVMSEIIGHLDRLETLAFVKKKKENNIWMYEIVK